jgi:anti-anti-sigma factor
MDAGGFAIEVSEQGPTTVVTLAGELDLASSPQLRSVCADVAQAKPDTVRLDMRGITFLDSSGIGVLVQAQKRLDSQGAVLVLHGVRGHPRRVLDVAGLGTFFTLSDQPVA